MCVTGFDLFVSEALTHVRVDRESVLVSLAMRGVAWAVMWVVHEGAVCSLDCVLVSCRPCVVFHGPVEPTTLQSLVRQCRVVRWHDHVPSIFFL